MSHPCTVADHAEELMRYMRDVLRLTPREVTRTIAGLVALSVEAQQPAPRNRIQ